ncbi:MAG TPA: hypothetical protein VFB16_12690 [Bauldia sp.]|nr:hypothetical protein [Bauldia sp.]
MSNGDATRRRAILDAIDADGPDFDAWQDRALAAEARQAVLADRSLRAYRDEALALARGLLRVRAAVDADIAADGAAARIAAALAEQLRARPMRRLNRLAVAAILLAAVGLGGLFDLTVLSPAGRPGNDVVALDAFNIGLAEEATP